MVCVNFWVLFVVIVVTMGSGLYLLFRNQKGLPPSTSYNSDYAVAISEISFVLNGSDIAESKLRFIKEIVIRLSAKKGTLR